MVRAFSKLAALLLWVLIFYPIVWIATKANKPLWREELVQFCYRGILYICEIKLRTRGQISKNRPLLIVSNHLSYVDIPILASQANIRFTPKNEIANWPFIGSICKMTNCIFVDRRPGQIQKVGSDISTALAAGDVVSLFPEATTGNGIHLLGFKSGVFSIAEEMIDGKALHVQPVAIVYRAVHRLPIATTQWPTIAWYGDMELLPHLLQFLELGRVDAELVFLQPVTIERFGDRRSMARYCQEQIASSISEIKNEKLPAYARRFSKPTDWSKSKS